MSGELKFDAEQGGVYTAAGGYAIRRDGSEWPAYWVAYRPGSNGKPSLTPSHELGAGAGDHGWLKCLRLCREHRDGLNPTAPALPTTDTLTAAREPASKIDPPPMQQRSLL